MKKEIAQQLVNAYYKSNKQRRLKIVLKGGWIDESAYIAHLESFIFQKAKKIVVRKKNPIIHNVHILDASGSMMGEKFNEALKGINNEMGELKKDNSVKYTQTLVSFSNNSSIVNHEILTPIKDASVLKAISGGLTALLDAVGLTLTFLESKVKEGEKVLIKIFTDGGENDSKIFTWNTIDKMVKRLQEKGCTITFVGTQEDVNKVKKYMSVDDSNTLVHENTAESIARSFKKSLGSTMEYSESVVKGLDVKLGFYKKVGKL